MQNTAQIIARAADKCGFNRVRFSEKNIPTSTSNVVVLLYLGDLRSTLVLSSFLLKRFKEEEHASKYFILCSWPGNQGLFPYVDEYWEIQDERHMRTIYNSSKGLNNTSEVMSGYKRMLNGFFENVLDSSVFDSYYQFGLKQNFFDQYKHIKKFFPSIPSSMILGMDFNRRINSPGPKLVIYPAVYVQELRNGKYDYMMTSIEFWENLAQRLIDNGITPVVYTNFYTYDLSPKFVDKCIYLHDKDMLNVMAGMRASTCVLDLFTGISKMAIVARCPYILCQERSTIDYTKEYELDILLGNGIPRENYYIFPSICSEINKDYWNSGLFDGIIVKLESLIKGVDRSLLPAANEVEEIIEYAPAKREKNKKFGTHFIKVPKV